MEIRPVRPEEHAALGRITLEAYHRLVDGAWLGPYEEELLDVASRAAECVVLVAVDDTGVVVGGVTYVPAPGHEMSEFDDPDAAGIRMLAVDPTRQGEGIGLALSRTCVEHARADGRRRIRLHSTPVMTIAHRIYEGLGFVRRADLDVFVTEPPPYDDEPVHLMSFVLELGDAP